MRKVEQNVYCDDCGKKVDSIFDIIEIEDKEVCEDCAENYCPICHDKYDETYPKVNIGRWVQTTYDEFLNDIVKVDVLYEHCCKVCFKQDLVHRAERLIELSKREHYE